MSVISLIKEKNTIARRLASRGLQQAELLTLQELLAVCKQEIKDSLASYKLDSVISARDKYLSPGACHLPIQQQVASTI